MSRLNFILLSHNTEAVAPWITYLHLGLLVAMILALAFEQKLHAHKSVITGIAALIALLLGEVTGILPIFGEDGEASEGVPFYLEYIEWG